MQTTRIKMNIKKGDDVKVITGKDKGKTGKVLDVDPTSGRIFAEGLNIHIRYSRPKKRGDKGQRMEVPGGIPSSKVMLVCPSCGKPTRVSREVTDSGTFRKCKKCGKTI